MLMYRESRLVGNLKTVYSTGEKIYEQKVAVRSETDQDH